VRVGVAIFTYCGQITFGVTGDYDEAADVGGLASGIRAALTELVAAAEADGTLQTAKSGPDGGRR
jgi:hypothetical protein